MKTLHHRAIGIPALVLTAILWTGCSAPVSVRHVNPEPPVAAATTAHTLEARLDGIRAALQQVQRGESGALPAYNYLVARLVENLEAGRVDPWSAPVAVSTSGPVRTLRGRAPAGFNPQPFQLVPADTLEFHGEDAKHRAQIDGIGAPLVAVKSFEGIGHITIRQDQPLRNLTAVVRFEGTSATIELLDPYQTEHVTVAGGSRTLAADLSAPVMLGLSKARVDKLGFARLLNPSRYNQTVLLNFLQPYDQSRIPVLMVHGLDSTPATWAPMYFELLKDEQIRKNYQFWVFSYPSGYPYPYSASLLREELDEVRREFPGSKDMVIIGHSMGGIMSRLMITDAGEKLWLAAFGKPPSETPIRGGSRELLEDALIFDNRAEIDRAIFIAAPHRGSEVATNWIGRLGSRLVKLPGFVADVRNSFVSVATVDPSAMVLDRAPNSIDTLAPNNRFVLEINKVPIVEGLPYHTIVGDRGKGDTPDSSDGIVPYWSSHLDGAVSEKIVPSGHSAQKHPEAMAEVRRILLLHLRSAGS